MQAVLLDVAAEVVSLVAWGVVGGALGLAGFLMEDIALTNLLSGDAVLGLWYLYMGTLALYAGIYLIGVRTMPRQVAAVRDRIAA